MRKKLLLALLLACILFNGTFQKTNAQDNGVTGLELHLPLNGNAQDSSGMNRHGIIEGAKPTADRFGNPNGAFAFDNRENILVPRFSTDDFKGITVSVWVKTTKTSPQQQVIQGLVGVLYINWIKTGHFMAAFDGTGGNNKPGDISKTYVADGNWHLLTAANDGNTTRIFVDGVPEAVYSEQLITGTRDIQIGGGGWYFTGSLDDIKIFSYALSEKEVKALFNATRHTATRVQKADKQFISIYPNPVIKNHQLIVELPHNIGCGRLTITNMAGRQVSAQALVNTGNALKVDTRHFSGGIYMVNIVAETGTYTAKLIIP